MSPLREAEAALASTWPSVRAACRRSRARGPDAVATAASRAPEPGTRPFGVGWVGSSLVPISRLDSRAAVAVAASESKSNRLVQPTIAASARGRSVATPRAPSASRTPPSASTFTDWPGSSREAAAVAEVARSFSPHSMPAAASRASNSAVVGAELLVAKTTRTPLPRKAVTAPAASPIGTPESHTTPSRSMIQRAQSEEPPGSPSIPLLIPRRSFDAVHSAVRSAAPCSVELVFSLRARRVAAASWSADSRTLRKRPVSVASGLVGDPTGRRLPPGSDVRSRAPRPTGRPGGRSDRRSVRR